MNTRERFHAIMNFQPFDRLPLLEWAGWWDKTIDRWHTEGLPVDIDSLRKDHPRMKFIGHFDKMTMDKTNQ